MDQIISYAAIYRLKMDSFEQIKDFLIDVKQLSYLDHSF
jgi:hypothetical protein